MEAFESTDYKQHNAVFRNAAGIFADVSQPAGLDSSAPRAHRGAAFADFNNDGKIDVAVSSLGEKPELWENVSPGENNWLIVRLAGTKSNRDGIGAEVRIGNQTNHMTTSVGYASSSDFGIHFGFGKLARIGRVEVRWPSGVLQVLENVPTDQVLTVHEPDRR